ncbi:MAG TPA: aminotransferase class III-fold pyridoxal phosphate-dependent enzyme [bacterium]|nr:aminotransferase class III-fold pyridoxal phosphate-dependent enzyme [bacterium]
MTDRAAGTPAAGAATHVLHRTGDAGVLTAVRAEGVYVYDAAGRRYLDGSSGPLAVNLGHGVPEIIAAMERQLRQITFAHGSEFTTAAQERAADLVAAFAPAGVSRVFFVSGGSEATETAIKLVRQYWVDAGRPSKYKIISKRASYHGATLGALSLSGFAARRGPYGPLLLPFPHIPEVHCRRCPYGLTYGRCAIECATELEAAILREGADTVAAFIAEPVSGAANAAVVPPPEYFRLVREICDRHDVLFIADEVMTGFGRTGANFAIDHWRVIPDLIVCAKGLGAGYVPIGAVVAHERIGDRIMRVSGRFIHGHTYAGNPLACATAAAVLEYIQTHGLVAAAKQKGTALERELDPLRAHPRVAEVRGLGLMWGVEFASSGSDGSVPAGSAVVAAAMRNGLLVYPAGGSLPGSTMSQILVGPPLTITDGEITELGRLLRKSVADAFA